MLKENQKIIMMIIMNWCKEKSDPISLIDIAIQAKGKISLPSLKAALSSLIKKGYIRKAVNVKPISYVKLRNLGYYEYQEFYEKEVR